MSTIGTMSKIDYPGKKVTIKMDRRAVGVSEKSCYLPIIPLE